MMWKDGAEGRKDERGDVQKGDQCAAFISYFCLRFIFTLIQFRRLFFFFFGSWFCSFSFTLSICSPVFLRLRQNPSDLGTFPPTVSISSPFFGVLHTFFYLWLGIYNFLVFHSSDFLEKLCFSFLNNLVNENIQDIHIDF